MQSKLEVLEQLKQNVIATREADNISSEETEELDRIAADIEKAIQKERDNQQIEIFKKELDL